MNTELRLVIEKRIKDIKVQNPQFSMRAMARYLDLTPPALSEFIGGKRNFSQEKMLKILDRIPLDPVQKDRLESLLKRDKALKTKDEIERLQIELDFYYLVSEDIYYSLLCLIELEGFKFDANWMAKKINKTKKEVLIALERLIKLKLIIENDGTLVLNTRPLNTTDDISNKFLKHRHELNLKAAQESLLLDPVEDRYFTFETLAVSKEAFPEIKKAIDECQNKILKISKAFPKKEIYEFCFHFYPRTKKEIINEENQYETNH